MRPPRRVSLAVGACAAILLAACSSGSESPAATTASPSAEALAEPTPTSPATATASPTRPARASAIPSPTPAKTVAPPSPPSMPAELLGTWSGRWEEPPAPYGSTTPLVFTVTLQTCAWSTPCGHQYTSGTDASGNEVGCGWDLFFNGQVDEPRPGLASPELGPWLRFREGDPEAIGAFKGCSGGPSCRDYIRLRPDGTLEFAASCAADVWQGVYELRRASATPSP